MEDQGLNKAEAQAAINALSETLKEMIYSEVSYTGNKKLLVDTVMNKMFAIFDAAAEKYHSYAIELPIQLEEGAQVPTYAHDSDAAADMYAMEDVEIPAHSKGTPVKTGVHIQLPEGWVAFILPRSSIGAKTPLRLSNSAGVIDSGYRGEVRALYDNIGDEPYQIHKGDRIAQMLVMPSYRFKANVVDSLEDSDRGEAGFGSTGV
jgi:dUTP pyrophosphatase